jgi:membrane protease YdiL (CAAX protease family)
MLPGGQNWACWLFYQFMYVAVAEEVFFRGYVQDNILRLISTVKLGQYGLQQSPTLQPVRRSVCEVGSFGDGAWISITLSAACFAAAHIIIQGQIISVLTFLPGLILGWLFIRTRSLLAPILFHGLANICYFLMAVAFA